MSEQTVKDFMLAMRENFGNFEFLAVSPQGHVIQSKGWQDIDDRKAVIPQLQMKGKK